MVLHPERQGIEQAQRLLSKWLQKMGLAFKPSKTRICHTLNLVDGQVGFDFLGFSVRQYRMSKYRSGRSMKGYKTIIQPSKAAMQKHVQRLQGVVRSHKAAPQAALIHHLNPIIRGWSAYYSAQCSKKAYSKLDYLLYQKLRAWAHRRHPNKTGYWRASRYWLVNDGGGWVFAARHGNQRVCLCTHTAIATARRNRRGRRNCSVGIVEDWKQDLQTEMQEGWTGYGQTNHFLKTIACYGVVFERLKGDALAEFVHETAINSPGYKRWCQHQHEISLRTSVWARSAEKYYWALGDSPKRSGEVRSQDENNVVSFNLSRSQDAQRRIKEAFSRLEQSGQLPPTATARAKAISAQGVSLRTLYRHLDLWHPIHNQDERAGSCKTFESEQVSTIRKGGLENPPKVAALNHSKEFYTLGVRMKCDYPESRSIGDGVSELTSSSLDPESRSYSTSDSNSFILQTDQTPRRFPFSEIVTVDSQSKMLQLTLEKVSENRTVTNHESFPPVVCDRLPVLVKLLQTWIDGYQSWVWQLRRIE